MKYSHRDIKQLLYDYLTEELDDTVRSDVARHLAECTACAAEVEHLREVLHRVPKVVTRASEQRSEEFWNGFARRVEQRIGPKWEMQPAPMLDVLTSWFYFRRPALAAAGVALAGVGIVVSVWIARMAEVQPPHDQIVEQAPVDEHVERVGQYFRRSKSLLVGLTNKKAPEGVPLDLSLERQVSRQLVEEARQLREQPLDPGATQLIDEMERILIELANAEDAGVQSNMDLLRSGIRQENLLFKVRMAEAVYGSPTFMNASYRK